MATKSIAEKPGIKPDTTVWSSPAERIELIEPMPERGRRVEGPKQAATAVVFVDDSTSARKIIAGEATRLAAAGSFWVAYRKGNRTDINRDRSLAIHADHGMRPMGQVAIDDVWAGLALVPGMAAAIVSFQLASRLVRRIRPSVLISAGLSVVSAVCWCSRDRASTPARGARRRVRVDELRRGATRGIGDPPGGRIGSSGGSGIGRRAGAGRQRVRLRPGDRLARKHRDHRLSPEFTGVIPPGITDAAAAAAGDTLAGATTAGHALPDHLASALLIPARAKFTSGLHVVALIAAAGLASVGILIAITLGHLPPIGQAQSSRRDGSRAWRERQADRRGDRRAREMRIDRFSTRATSAPASGSDPNGERAVVPRTAQAARDVLTSVVGTLLDLGMPSHEIAAVVAADQPVVHRYLELHRERLAEQLAYQLQILARIEGILTRAILALESRGPSSP